MRAIKDSQDYISNKHDDLLAEFKNVTAEQKTMKNDMKTMTSRQMKFSSELVDLKWRLNKLEHEKIPSRVIIRGMVESDDALAYKLTAKRTWLVRSGRPYAAMNRLSLSLFKAELTNEDKKKELVKTAKLKKVTTSMLANSSSREDDRPIYVDDIVTQHTRT